MPRKKRRDLRRLEVLTVLQRWELLLGPRSCDSDRCAFQSDGERRAAWAIHGRQILDNQRDESVKIWAMEEYGYPRGAE